MKNVQVYVKKAGIPLGQRKCPRSKVNNEIDMEITKSFNSARLSLADTIKPWRSCYSMKPQNILSVHCSKELLSTFYHIAFSAAHFKYNSTLLGAGFHYFFVLWLLCARARV
jgi:hypothetical protein